MEPKIKLIIQIPCFNEAKTLAISLKEIPKTLDGVDNVEILIVDDGSTDNTSAIAIECDVDHVVRHTTNLGLARAFTTGIETCINLGADIIVNTDADNQYDAKDIPKLIAPILSGEAEFVIGERPISSTSHFSPVKKLLQFLGSAVVRKVSGTNIPDAPSGFRAISRNAAMQLNVFSSYTYTLETIIQAGHKGIAVTSVPINTNPDLRPSRLMSSISSYIRRSMLTMLRIFMVYKPLEFFAIPGIVTTLIGTFIGLRFLYHFLNGDGTGYIQSLILTAILVSIGVGLILIGMLADLISVNRKLLEKIKWKNNYLDLKEPYSSKQFIAGPNSSLLYTKSSSEKTLHGTSN